MGGQSHTAGPYLLMKRGLYYRPDAKGYTGIRDNAGRYTKAEAKDHADPVSGVVPVLLAEAPEFSPKCFDDLALAHALKQRDALVGALDRASAAIQRLHTDVEALMADSDGVYGLHGNGDPAPWDELREGGRFDDWIGEPLSAARRAYHDARAAIAKATGEASA